MKNPREKIIEILLNKYLPQNAYMFRQEAEADADRILALLSRVEITGEMINAQLYRLNINGVSNDKCQSLADWFNNLGKENEE